MNRRDFERLTKSAAEEDLKKKNKILNMIKTDRYICKFDLNGGFKWETLNEAERHDLPLYWTCLCVSPGRDFRCPVCNLDTDDKPLYDSTFLLSIPFQVDLKIPLYYFHKRCLEKRKNGKK